MALNLTEIGAALHSLEITTETVATPASDLKEEVWFGLLRRDAEPVLVCRPPWHRLDLTIPADLTEEVARMIGYDQVGYTYMPEEIPQHIPSPELATEERNPGHSGRHWPAGSHRTLLLQSSRTTTV